MLKRRSSLGSLSTLLLCVQSIPKIDTRPLRLNMKAGAIVSCSSIPSLTGAEAEEGREAVSQPTRLLSSPSPADRAPLPGLKCEEHNNHKNFLK